MSESDAEKDVEVENSAPIPAIYVSPASEAIDPDPQDQ